MNPYLKMHDYVRSNPIKDFVKSKNSFDYLPWSIALHYLKVVFPEAKLVKESFGAYTATETVVPYMKDADGNAWVKCTVAWGDFVTSEIYPVTNYNNQAIKNPTSKDVDNAHQRCMAKCIAMFCGLGLELWHNEELPFEESEDTEGGNVSAGLDNSEQKAEREAASGQTEKNRDVFTTSERSDAAQTPKKINAPLTLQQQIDLAPSIGALTELYRREELRLSSSQKQLFTTRRRELENG